MTLIKHVPDSLAAEYPEYTTMRLHRGREHRRSHMMKKFGVSLSLWIVLAAVTTSMRAEVRKGL